MEKIVALLGCDCIVLVAGYYDIYRKPAIGSFRYLQSLFSSPIEAASFFCGDTYGTCCGPSSPLGKKPKKLTDILFAKNCGVPFYTPSDFFSSSSLSFLLSSSIMPLNAFSFSNKLPSAPHPHTHSSLFIVPLTLKLNAIASFNTFNEGTSIPYATHFFQLSIVTSRAKRKHLILALNSRNSSTFCKTKRPSLPSSPSKEPSPIATVCKWGRSAKKN